MSVIGWPFAQAAPVVFDTRRIHREDGAELAAEAKFAFDCVGRYARPDLFRFEVDRIPRAPVSFVDGKGYG